MMFSIFVTYIAHNGRHKAGFFVREGGFPWGTPKTEGGVTRGPALRGLFSLIFFGGLKKLLGFFWGITFKTFWCFRGDSAIFLKKRENFERPYVQMDNEPHKPIFYYDWDPSKRWVNENA